MIHETVYIPVLIDNPEFADYNKITPMHYPETSSDVKPLPFVWSVALFRFISRMSLRIDSRDKGILPRTISVFRFPNSDLAAMWKVSINPIARKLIDLLLTGSKHRVFNEDDKMPGCETAPVWARGTLSQAEARMSVDNVVIAAIEEANGYKIARGAKRSLWNQVELIETAMFTWTMQVIQFTSSPTTHGWATMLGKAKIQSKNPDVVRRVKMLWVNYVTSLKKSAANAPVLEPLPGMPPLPKEEPVCKGSPPLPERISTPMIPKYSNCQLTPTIASSEIPTIQPIEDVADEENTDLLKDDTFEAVSYDEIVCEENELKSPNEMIVRSFIEKPGNTIFSKSWSLFPISSRLDIERQLWGLTRSLLI